MSYAATCKLFDSGSTIENWNDWTPATVKPSRVSATVSRASQSYTYNLAELTANPVRQEFYKLMQQWKENVIDYSTITQMITDKAYLRIIALGRPVVIYILKELEMDPDYWFVALRAILNVDPVENSDRGNLGRMADAWVSWGKSEGYLSH